jgi:hypothetical protein
MEPIFFYQEWLGKRLYEYVHVPQTQKLRGRKIEMTPRQYASALMQAYFGRASLTWIAEHVRIPLQLLQRWRKEPQFLLIMDWSKSLFSKAFQEKLILNDYSMSQYYFMSAEISLLEESLRLIVRMPLNRSFLKIGRSIMSRHQNDIDLNNYDLRLFRRLFLFFLALEAHWPGESNRCVNKNFITLAKHVVWPLLNQKQWVGQEFNSIRQNTPMSQILLELDRRLSDTLQGVI